MHIYPQSFCDYNLCLVKYDQFSTSSNYKKQTYEKVCQTGKQIPHSTFKCICSSTVQGVVAEFKKSALKILSVHKTACQVYENNDGAVCPIFRAAIPRKRVKRNYSFITPADFTAK